MTFKKRLRAPIMRGEITCSVRIWRRPHVKVGEHYRLGEGFIEVTLFRRITLSEEDACCGYGARPKRFLATPKFKVTRELVIKLKANSISARC